LVGFSALVGFFAGIAIASKRIGDNERRAPTQASVERLFAYVWDRGEGTVCRPGADHHEQIVQARRHC
jgi:hypothetical protein